MEATMRAIGAKLHLMVPHDTNEETSEITMNTNNHCVEVVSGLGSAVCLVIQAGARHYRPRERQRA